MDWSRHETRLARLLGLAALVVVVAACGSSAATASGSPVVSAGATATAEASASPSPSPSPTATPEPVAADWPTYHLDRGRSGYNAEFPALKAPLVQAWSAKLDGAVYAEPLVIHGLVIAATEGDSVYALDPQTGSVVWRRNLGTPVRLSTLPCGNIDPLGITSTPAFDPKTGSLFTVAEVSGFKHVMFALDPATGEVRWERNVDLAGDDPRAHQQRAALVVGDGYVYFGYGGLAGDCGQYLGEVVGVPTSGQGDTVAYRVPTSRMGAVWATGGPVVDEAGNVFASVGNGASTGGKFDGSDSIVALTPELKRTSFFAPTSWASDNARDADLGSLSPTLVPGGYVFIAGKSGTGYVMRQANLGGIGGQISSATVCKGFGGTARVDRTIYVPCRTLLRQVTVGADGKLTVGWLSTAAGGPPVVGGGAVWSISPSGVLAAINPSNGKATATISVGSVPHFASPTLWNGLVLVGTMQGVVAVKGS